MVSQRFQSVSVLQSILIFHYTLFTPLFPFISTSNSRHALNQKSTSIFANAFRYRLPAQEITAPEMLCFSGDATTHSQTEAGSSYYPWSTLGSKSQFSCPTTPEEVESYPAVYMDKEGYVKVHIWDIRLRDDGRRRSGLHRSASGGRAYRFDQNRQNHRRARKKKKKKNITTSQLEVQETHGFSHHLQAYLVPLEEYSPIVLRSQCCYQLEIDPPDWVERTSDGNIILPEECRFNPNNNHNKIQELIGNKLDNSVMSAFSHDYRVNAARIGPLGYTSAPIYLNLPDDEPGREFITTLRPNEKGRYMIVISNCAAELNYDPITNTTSAKGLKMVMDGIDVNFVSKFGELPLSMMGIIPFYGMMTSLYFLLSLVWVRSTTMRTRKKNATGYIPVTLLGVQNAIRILVFCQTGFSALAFSYYLYLNGTSVDIKVLYSGTAAALVNWGPWSIAVALAHFGTLLGCQIVVTLATDGMWLIQSSAQNGTKRTLYFMGFIWGIYFVSYGFLTLTQRRVLYCVFGVAWILFLLSNIRRSLKHLRNLMVGQSTDQVIAVGGAIVAKRSMYRKMLIILGVYPIIFTCSFIWSLSSIDSWAWVGYVLVDIYLFVILVHASITWIPRPMASQEFIKYAPLEVSTNLKNDLDLWEEVVDGEYEIEMKGSMDLD